MSAVAPVGALATPGRAAVLLGSLFGLVAMSTSAVTVALPALAAGLGITASTAAWVVSGYAVALAVATATHGRLADTLGIRLPLCAGVVVMAVGAVVAALAPSFPVLVVARVAQGLGAAAVPVLATALISARVGGVARGAALGRLAGIAATLSALGPLIGGAVEALGGWRLSLALPALGALALPALWRAAPSRGTGVEIDLPGAVLVAMAATGLVLLLQSPSAGLVVAVVGAVLLLVAGPAVAARVRARPDGFLPRTVVTNPTVLRSAFAAASVPASWFALLLGVPLVAANWGWTPLATGALLVPAAAVGFVSPRIAGVLLTRVGDRRTIALACPTSVLALLVASLGATRAATGASPVLLALAVMLVTAAFGIGQPAMISSVSAAVPSELRGVALGVATLVFLVGASVGAALIGGLAQDVGFPLLLAMVSVLPLGGLAVLLSGGPDRTDPAGGGPPQR